ncbi:MAG TPA: hypothetical protein VLD37_05240 [Candidatus Bilamarchaeum sp.]|nr:hypothetical protein [Candidatus Bilamarchaeum sp.]
MQDSRFVSLSPKDILPMKRLREMFEKKTFQKFKSVIEGGCVPVHISDESKTGRPTTVIIGPANGYPPPRLELPKEVMDYAAAISARENAAVGGSWIDGEKLAVVSALSFRSTLSILVKRMQFSQIAAMRDDTFADISARGAFKLDTNTHLTAMEGGHEVLIIGQRGRKPSEPKMGSEVFLAPAEGAAQLTLATSSMVGANLLSSGSEMEAWAISSVSELGTLGYALRHSVRYLGLMLDPLMFRGAVGILGELRTMLSPAQIEQHRKNSRHYEEVPVIDTVPLEAVAVSAYLRANRDRMVPQLITGLAVLGYERWGPKFLDMADK